MSAPIFQKFKDQNNEEFLINVRSVEAIEVDRCWTASPQSKLYLRGGLEATVCGSPSEVARYIVRVIEIFGKAGQVLDDIPVVPCGGPPSSAESAVPTPAREGVSEAR